MNVKLGRGVIRTTVMCMIIGKRLLKYDSIVEI